MAPAINVEYYVHYVHTQNWLVKSLINRVKLIAVQLLTQKNISYGVSTRKIYCTGLLQMKLISSFVPTETEGSSTE